jgi:hypothetical protein
MAIVNYCIVEYDTGLYQCEVDQRSAAEPERAYLKSVAQKCVENFFDNRMEDCNSCHVQFDTPGNDDMWHEMYVYPEHSVTFVAESYKPLLAKDVLGELQ